MTFREALTLGEQILGKAGIVDAKNDAWLLLTMVCHIDHTFYYTHSDEDLTEEQTAEFSQVLKKRAERIPLQYITGEQEFMGLTFRVNSSVLVPRQDTECLVEEALKTVRSGMRILDMCTGSGCILISILKNSANVIGLGADISKTALAVAKENARIHDVPAAFEWSNLFDKIDDKFDMIVSNPPYIPTDVIPTLMPEVAQFEPTDALDGKEDGLYFYQRIIEEAKDYLVDGGHLLFEIGYDQGQAVSEMMSAAGFLNVQIIQDLAKNDRVVRGHL